MQRVVSPTLSPRTKYVLRFYDTIQIRGADRNIVIQRSADSILNLSDAYVVTVFTLFGMILNDGRRNGAVCEERQLCLELLLLRNSMAAALFEVTVNRKRCTRCNLALSHCKCSWSCCAGRAAVLPRRFVSHRSVASQIFPCSECYVPKQ
jgi:hypothetical protein